MITPAAIEVSVHPDIPRADVDAARERLASLEKYTGRPLIEARLTLRAGSPHTKNKWVADGSTLHDGRVLAAHAAGPTPLEAVDAVVDRLRRQLRRVVGADVAQRNEPRAIQAALESLAPDRTLRPEASRKPPEEREIVRRRTYADGPESTLEAIADMLDLDEEFHVFTHVRTGEDVVVYRRDDSRVGLLHPPDSPLADEGDLVAAEPSRYSSPLTLEAARAEMDLLNHRFLYFIDEADGRGKVIHLRHDGDYGLVEPE